MVKSNFTRKRVEAYSVYPPNFSRDGLRSVIRDLALWALAQLPPPDRYRHLKRGSTYSLVGDGRVQTEVPLRDMDEVVIYRSEEDGTLWVRPPTEFHDGRFSRILEGGDSVGEAGEP